MRIDFDREMFRCEDFFSISHHTKIIEVILPLFIRVRKKRESGADRRQNTIIYIMLRLAA